MTMDKQAHQGASQHQGNVSAAGSKSNTMNEPDQSVTLWVKQQQFDTSLTEAQFMNVSAAPALLC